MLQEVYEWAGANEPFPPYFTLHRGSVLASHKTVQNDETLDVTEQVSRQWDLLNFKSGHFLNFTPQSRYDKYIDSIEALSYCTVF